MYNIFVNFYKLTKFLQNKLIMNDTCYCIALCILFVVVLIYLFNHKENKSEHMCPCARMGLGIEPGMGCGCGKGPCKCGRGCRCPYCMGITKSEHVCGACPIEKFNDKQYQLLDEIPTRFNKLGGSSIELDNHLEHLRSDSFSVDLSHAESYKYPTMKDTCDMFMGGVEHATAEGYNPAQCGAEHVGIVGSSGQGAVGQGLASFGGYTGSGGVSSSLGAGSVSGISNFRGHGGGWGGHGGGWGGHGGHGGGWGGHRGRGYYGSGYIGSPWTSSYPYWAWPSYGYLDYGHPYYEQQQKLYKCYSDCPDEPFDDRRECYELCRKTYKDY